MDALKNAPKHIGIILDGNRRFAKRLMMQPWKGHELGFEKFKQLFQWCREMDIRELTLYCFSMQNFNRPKREFDFLMNVFSRALREALTNKDIHENKIRINVIGRWHLFPEALQKDIRKVMEATKEYNNYQINLAMAYGGREEIIDCMKRIAVGIKEGKIEPDKVDESLINENIYMSHEPDLIIRTGGERRTSNFLIWQGHYAEWFFLEKMWPEFEKEDLADVIAEYRLRERRFGR